MGVSFTPPTGPNGGMSKDGHATVLESHYLKWGVVVLAVVLIWVIWKGKK